MMLQSYREMSRDLLIVQSKGAGGGPKRGKGAKDVVMEGALASGGGHSAEHTDVVHLKFI